MLKLHEVPALHGTTVSKCSLFGGNHSSGCKPFCKTLLHDHGMHCRGVGCECDCNQKFGFVDLMTHCLPN